MLALDRQGSGDPLLLLHGTTSSRRIWDPLIPRLAEHSEVLALDLPGHGDSPATSFAPPQWAEEVAGLLDELGLERVAVIGHSSGGWTALELAKAGRASAVVALAPAGLWRDRSPWLVGFLLNANWRLGRLAGGLAPRALRYRPLRALSLRSVSARPGAVPAEVAIANTVTMSGTESFPRHFAETHPLRFLGGQGIDVPVTVVWGDKDWIAPAGKSRNRDQLPPHAEVETWANCGHMLMWDAPDRVLEVARTLSGSRAAAGALAGGAGS